MAHWWTRAKGLLAGVLPSGVEPTSTPSAAPNPAWYGDQLRTPQERARMLRDHARRQAAEAKQEAEQARLAAEALKLELRRAPNNALLPPSGEPLTGLAGLAQFIDELQRAGARRF